MLKAPLKSILFLIPLLLGSSFAQAHSGSLGLGLSAYRYEETSYDATTALGYKLMELEGTQLKAEFLGILDLNDRHALRTDLSFSGGRVDYDSKNTGSLKDLKNDIYNLRIAWEVPIKNFFLDNLLKSSVYFGGGYRRLFNDLRGRTTTGALGYKRISQYAFLLGGWDYETRFANSKKWSWNINPELGLLVWGQQSSYLNVAPLAKGGIHKRQTTGINLRFKSSLSYRLKWQFGLFFDAWVVPRSEASRGYIEPENTTLDIGLFSAIRF